MDVYADDTRIYVRWGGDGRGPYMTLDRDGRVGEQLRVPSGYPLSDGSRPVGALATAGELRRGGHAAGLLNGRQQAREDVLAWASAQPNAKRLITELSKVLA